MKREAYDFAGALAELRETGADCAIGTSTASVVDAAKRRGIPVIRLTDTANLFQLGWGRRQKRLQATVTGCTRHIAVDIASDKQLTKSLLQQAGLPVPQGEAVRTIEAALRVADSLGGPVTIKPLDANQGRASLPCAVHRPRCAPPLPTRANTGAISSSSSI